MRKLGIGAAIAAVLLAAAPAGATSCRQWGRLAYQEKVATAIGMVQDVVYSNAARSYNVPKPQIERCASAKADAMVIEIDDTCSDSRTASKQAPRRVVDRYILSCVSSRRGHR